jgi:hypothetical protein
LTHPDSGTSRTRQASSTGKPYRTITSTAANLPLGLCPFQQLSTLPVDGQLLFELADPPSRRHQLSALRGCEAWLDATVDVLLPRPVVHRLLSGKARFRSFRLSRRSETGVKALTKHLAAVMARCPNLGLKLQARYCCCAPQKGAEVF